MCLGRILSVDCFKSGALLAHRFVDRTHFSVNYNIPGLCLCLACSQQLLLRVNLSVAVIGLLSAGGDGIGPSKLKAYEVSAGGYSHVHWVFLV
jgi:hypothetical protein